MIRNDYYVYFNETGVLNIHVMKIMSFFYVKLEVEEDQPRNSQSILNQNVSTKKEAFTTLRK